MDVLGDPNIAAHQAKQILGYKSVNRMINELKPTDVKFSRFSSNNRLAYLEYDDDGFAKPVMQGEAFDFVGRFERNGREAKKYSTIIILKALDSCNEKSSTEFFEKLLTTQPTMIKTILGGKNCVQLFNYIIKNNKCSVAKFFVDHLAENPKLKRVPATLSEFKTNNMRLFKLLRDIIKIKYEKDETEMRWIDEPSDCEIIHDIEYLWLNENFDIVKHYFEFIDEEVITDSMHNLQGFSDAGFCHIYKYLTADNANMYTHLTFKSNFMRCLQIIHGKDLRPRRTYIGSLDMNLIMYCFPEIDMYNQGIYLNGYHSASSIRDSRILETELPITTLAQRTANSYHKSAVFYKLIKNSPNCCVSSDTVIYILRVFIKVNNDFFLQSAEMLFGNFFCVVDKNLLSFVCGSKDYDNPYIRIALNSIDSKAAKVHSCENETCPFRASRRSKR
jgi:hypothetical protein